MMVAPAMVARPMVMRRGVMRHGVMTVMRPRGRHAGREGKGDGGRERQGDDFQGLSPKVWCVPRISIRPQAAKSVQTNAGGATQARPRPVTEA